MQGRVQNGHLQIHHELLPNSYTFTMHGNYLTHLICEIITASSINIRIPYLLLQSCNKFEVNIFHKYSSVCCGIPSDHSWFATKKRICSYCEVWKCFCALDYSPSVCSILDSDVSDIDVVLCQLGARKVSWLMR